MRKRVENRPCSTRWIDPSGYLYPSHDQHGGHIRRQLKPHTAVQCDAPFVDAPSMSLCISLASGGGTGN